jgi:4-amino-4-deoxy-L-arabinose transferase-like glycosyltransferase
MQSFPDSSAVSPARPRRAWVDPLCLLLLCVWIAAYSYPFFFNSLIGNVREIQSYNLDSMMMLNGVNGALASPGLRLRFNDYGHFYFNLAIVASVLYSMFAPVTETVVMTILRLFSLLGGCALIAMVFVFARRYLGRIEALFAAAVLAFSPALIQYSNEVKPDTWQIFFILLTLYYLARASEATPAADGARRGLPVFGFRFVLAAAAAAGVAFGTKYLGMFLLPLVGIAALLVSTSTLNGRLADRAGQKRIVLFVGCALAATLAMAGLWAQPTHVLDYLQVQKVVEPGSKVYLQMQLLRVACLAGAFLCLAVALAYALVPGFAGFKQAFAARALILLGSAGAFIAGFVASSPWLLWRLQFVRELYARDGMVGAGERLGFTWLKMLFGVAGQEQMYVAHAVGVLAVAGVALMAVALALRRWRGTALAMSFVLGFALIFLALLMTKINRAAVLYALPLVPCLVLLAAYGLHELRRLAGPRVGESRAAAGIALLAVILVIAQAWQGIGILKGYGNLVVALTPANRQLGEWYTRCAPPQARILSASYTYVPPMFSNLIIGEDYSYFVRAAPDIATVNIEDAAATAREEAAAANAPGYTPSERVRFYNEIARPGAWVPGPLFGHNRVYVKAGYALNSVCR